MKILVSSKVSFGKKGIKLVSSKVSFCEKGFKYFIGYKDVKKLDLCVYFFRK